MRAYLFLRTRTRFDTIAFTIMGVLIGTGYAAAGICVIIIAAVISGMEEEDEE